MEILHTRPSTSSFTPLSEHQSQTPESFYSGPAILYHHSISATLKVNGHDLDSAPALSGLANGAHRSTNGHATAFVTVNGDASPEEEQNEEVEITNIDIWITSERFILFSPSLQTGISIPYPSISLHAIQRPSTPSTPSSLFIQLLTASPTFDDHDPDSTISLTLVPATSTSNTNPTPAETGDDEPSGPVATDPVQEIYTALCDCANLHPDPLSGSEDDGDGERHGQNPAIMFEGDADISGVYPLANAGGAAVGSSGLPPPMPGSGGWITAENVGEYFDDEGNWRGGGGLGEGAGVVRGREEGEGDAVVDGEGEGDGQGEETKWQRTE